MHLYCISIGGRDRAENPQLARYPKPGALPVNSKRICFVRYRHWRVAFPVPPHPPGRDADELDREKEDIHGISPTGGSPPEIKSP